MSDISTYTCEVCSCLYKDPICLDCGHCFCKECIGLLHNKKCPCCQATIENKKYPIIHKLKPSVNDLRYNEVINIEELIDKRRTELNKINIEITEKESYLTRLNTDVMRYEKTDEQLIKQLKILNYVNEQKFIKVFTNSLTLNSTLNIKLTKSSLRGVYFSVNGIDSLSTPYFEKLSEGFRVVWLSYFDDEILLETFRDFDPNKRIMNNTYFRNINDIPVTKLMAYNNS